MTQASLVTSSRAQLRDLMSRAASADPLDAVYQSALNCVQQGLGIDRAALLLFDALGTMRFVAWAGLSDEYRRAVDGHSPWSRDETDAAPVLVSDVETDTGVAGYRPLMRQENIRALAFIPLQFGKSLLGKFMLYYPEPHEFTAVEIATAEQIADYVVFALEHHRMTVLRENQWVSERNAGRRREDQLLSERNAASEAGRRKDDFLATLAHELRNPMAAIRIGAAVIRRASDDPTTVAEYCDVVERQLRHLTRLVDDLLDVANVTRRGLPVQKTSVEFSSVVRAALEQCRDLVEDAGHELAVEVPTEPMLLDADPERIVQVLTNLLSNAVKYTRRGGRIELRCVREEGQIRVSVKDTGLGIPPDKLDSVFEMFSQLDRSTETGHKGLGIGLALVRALVSMHGGRIEARSDGIGTGSEFIFWLPLVPSEEATTLADQSSAARAAGSCRVLVVDDNQDVANATSRLLRVLGHDVRVALNGADALSIADQFRPEVVLLDIGMPGMNGFDVARALRANPWGRDMTLVAVTGWGQEEDQRRSTAAGFDRHMTKPVDPLMLEGFLDSIARQQPVAY